MFDDMDDDIDNEINEPIECDIVEYILTLPLEIRGTYDTVVNKLMISNFKFELPIDKAFYRDMISIFKIEDKAFLDFVAVIMYDILAINIINEMWGYIQQYPKIVFKMDFTDCLGPTYPEQTTHMINFYLRKRGFNAVKYNKGSVYYVCVDNFNSGGDKKTRFKKSVSYLASAMFSGIRDGLPTIKLDVERLVNNLDYGTVRTKIIGAMEIQPAVKGFLEDIDLACDNLNSTKFLDSPLIRMEELYIAMEACLESIGDLLGSNYASQPFYVKENSVTCVQDLALFLQSEGFLSNIMLQDIVYMDVSNRDTQGFTCPMADMDLRVEAMQAIVVSYYTDITNSFTDEVGMVTAFKGPYDFSFIK